MTTTAKRQRQREGRVARLESERKAARRAARRRRIITAAVVLALVLGVMAVIPLLSGGDDSEETSDQEAPPTTATTAPEKPEVTIPETPPPASLETTDLVVGDGPEARAGGTAQVHYVGKVYATGEEFDSSYEGGGPISFAIGSGEVIPGWDQGVAGMRVGGRRQLVIPPDLAYGEQGSPPVIPANATLVFVVDLLSVDEAPAEPGG